MNIETIAAVTGGTIISAANIPSLDEFEKESMFKHAGIVYWSAPVTYQGREYQAKIDTGKDEQVFTVQLWAENRSQRVYLLADGSLKVNKTLADKIATFRSLKAAYAGLVKALKASSQVTGSSRIPKFENFKPYGQNGKDGLTYSPKRGVLYILRNTGTVWVVKMETTGEDKFVCRKNGGALALRNGSPEVFKSAKLAYEALVQALS